MRNVAYFLEIRQSSLVKSRVRPHSKPEYIFLRKIINYNSFFFVFNIEVDLQFYNVLLQDTYKLFLISFVIYGGTLVDNKNIKDLYQLLIPINLTIPYRIDIVKYSLVLYELIFKVSSPITSIDIVF
ncbi:hypothetical protein RCL_jg5050.t1 [Rhizophagus clarus]|uniref:Uncharacterized protein n=1 Tax=Rhizophagus clarus TaxID=94130 RepID=A0A8H3L8Y4_9GLOM|nr:hypothetical protein RCL_jg5050.t1 [Rhizophagus clarus]